MRKLALVALLLWSAGCASGQKVSGPPLATYTCYRARGQIMVDGELNEPSWRAARSVGQFATYDGDRDIPGTSAWMVWDDRMLYVAFECTDRDIYATYEERDGALYNQDVVEVFIMEQSVGQGHFVEFEVSPIGTLFDVYNVKPYVGILAWESPEFRAAARLNGTPNKPGDKDTGYTVEIAIPFKDLYLKPPHGNDATPLNGDVLRMNLYRIDYSTPPEEKMGDMGARPIFITWSQTVKLRFHMPQRFGVVTFCDRPAGSLPEE